MKITDLRLARLQVPLITPFKTALRTATSADDIVVMIDTDTGHTGYGAAAATAVITGDTHGAIIAAIRDHIRPRLIGREIADHHRNLQLVQDALEGNTSAKAAADIALHDVWAQAHGVPLYQLLGGGSPCLSTDITISADEPDIMVAAARRAIDRGFTALKIKLGKDSAQDVARVRAIFRAVEGRAILRLDANQGWTAKQAIHILRTLEADGLHFDLLEQPVKALDIDGLKQVADSIRTPVMADESVFGPRDALELIRRRAADIINIKLMKAGGIANAMLIAELARLSDMDCLIGCMIETGISVAAAAHLAVARGDCITRVDLDAPSLCTHDPVDGGVQFHDADIRIDARPGLGIRSIKGLQSLPPV